MIQKFSALEDYTKKQKPIGFFADTTILFSASHPSDIFNTESEKAFEILADYSVPTFASVNVRAEFLENHRRAYIADSLVDFLEDNEKKLAGPLLLKLQTHRKSHRKKVDEGRSTKLDLNQIKSFRLALSEFALENRNGWEILCQDYLKPQLTPVWDETQIEFDLNFISTRANDLSPFLDKLPSWERAVEIMGEYGIASADAMILNMFLCSKIPALLTSDLELAACAARESRGEKYIFVPDSSIEV
ncbi:MAG: hypothetical protein H6623_06930 [Bdellovibrionaceae bacterium]|nr:hypothetical protein [Pseudobdellovibrionaceae bacterium]